MLKLGVLVSGGGTNLQAIIDGIRSEKIHARIETVVSSRKSAFALERARKCGIEGIFISQKGFAEPGGYERALITHFQNRNVGLVVYAGFNVILDPAFIDFP